MEDRYNISMTLEREFAGFSKMLLISYETPQCHIQMIFILCGEVGKTVLFFVSWCSILCNRYESNITASELLSLFL
jgi:hypothetical protein